MSDPQPSTIQITIGGVDVTTDVEYESVSFQSQLSAQPGTFELKVRDPHQTHSFITGKEIILTVDGTRLFGGFVTQVSRTYALPVVDTSTPANVDSREWVLRGTDYNVLFDKLVVRNPAAYTTQLPNEPHTSYDGDLIKKLCTSYLDVPAGLDFTTLVENVKQPALSLPAFVWYSTNNAQQGTTWRQQMDDLSINCGTVYFINANFQLVSKAIENTYALWGFSDVPNKRVVTGSLNPLPTYGFREVDATEDGSLIANDALVWGGSALGDPSGAGVFFARAQDAPSEATHGRWQYAENHVGQSGFGSQFTVNVRANQIVSGTDGGTDPATGTRRGYLQAQWQFRFAWFAHDVPTYLGSPNHLIPGELVSIILYVMKESGYPAGLIQTLPLRQVEIKILTLNSGLPYIRFDGYFGLLADDPFTLWRYLLAQRRRQQAIAAGAANDSSTTSSYGSFGQFSMKPVPDGVNKVFTTSPGIGYIPGTQIVTVNLLFQRPNYEYVTSNPSVGEIRFNVAPPANSSIYLTCRTL